MGLRLVTSGLRRRLALESLESKRLMALTDLRISEINYNPAEPTADELAQDPRVDDADFEFVELFNGGTTPVALRGLKVIGGFDFTFPDASIAAGEYLVIPRNRAAFELRYGTSIKTLGSFAGGSLRNGGENILVADDDGTVVLDVTYSDSELWPANPDGIGGTLNLVDPRSVPLDQHSFFRHWRGSTEFGGSPGRSAAAHVGVMINEVLSNTNPRVALEAVELFNSTNQPIDIGGWYLSDSADDLFKFRIPAGTVIGPKNYLVFNESDYNPTGTSLDSFALNGSHGDDVWLVSSKGDERITAFVDDVRFGAAANGESFARIPDGIGRLLPASELTLRGANTSARVGDIVISEVHFAPPAPSAAASAIDPTLDEKDLEFIELYNRSTSFIGLDEWRIRGGVEFDFPPNEKLDPGASMILVSFDPLRPDNSKQWQAFRTHYGLAANVRVFGGYSGQLASEFERITVLRPGRSPIDEPDYIPRLLEDEVVYETLAPWPGNTVETGRSLHRNQADALGNNPSSWSAKNPSPGAIQFSGAATGDFNSDGKLDINDVDELWRQLRSSTVDLRFDLTGDRLVDSRDRDHMIQAILKTFYGDTNLDGRFDSSDLVAIFQKGEYEDAAVGNSNWADGDWNANGDFETGDLILAFQSGRYES